MPPVSHRDDSLSIPRDPFQCHRCTDGPGTVLQFMGTGAFTFAGRMFWHLVEKFEAPMQNGPVPATALTPRPPLMFRDLLERSPSLQTFDAAEWAAMIGARSAHYGQEAVVIDPPDDPNDPPHSSSESTPNWLSPVLAERRIRDIVGDNVFAVLAGPMLDQWQTNKENYSPKSPQDSLLLVDGLLERLSESFTCFGGGPRWDIGRLDQTVRDWCYTIISTPSQVEGIE